MSGNLGRVKASEALMRVYLWCIASGYELEKAGIVIRVA